MLKLFRKGLKSPAVASLRAGHGWDAPPPPLPATYENKRLHNIFDSGMWWTCDTSPEYLVTYFEMHLHDQYGALAEMFRVGSYSLAWCVLLGIFVYFGYNRSIYHGWDEKTVKDFFKDQCIKDIQERGFLKRNSFGFSTTHEDGKVKVNYDTPTLSTVDFANIVKESDRIRQINLEAKNYIKKLEDLARKKYN